MRTANQAAIAIVNAQQFARVKADLDRAQREVRRLQIEVDQKNLDKELSEITDTEYFQRLSSLARDIRKKQRSDT